MSPRLRCWRRFTWYWLRRLLCWLGCLVRREMPRNGRPIDSDMPGHELLYLRCKAGWIDVNGRLKAANVHFPDQSVNRERYSSRYDVLLPNQEAETAEWIFWGVVKLTVEDVPSKGESPSNVAVTFTVEHDPLDDNYGHTELRAYKNGKARKEQEQDQRSGEEGLSHEVC